MNNQIRQFETGATRDDDTGKLDYEGFVNPLVLRVYAEYMNTHRVQSDGKVRPSDNWQKGIPMDAYMKSAFRHFHDVWMHHRGYAPTDHAGKAVDRVDALCALAFNVFGYLHELLKARESAPLPERTRTLTDLYSSTFSEGAIVSDFIPVEELDDYLTARFPQPGPIQRANQAQRDALAELRPDPNPTADLNDPVLQPTITLREQDRDNYALAEYIATNADMDTVSPAVGQAVNRAYTRGHADDTAARFNAGLPYADDLQADELPQAEDIQAAVDADAAEAIAGHPLFGVVIIDGPDAATYDGPEVCGIKPDTCGCYGSPPFDPNPLDGVPFAVLRKPEKDDERRWVVQSGIVYYAPDTHTEFKESRLTLDTVRSMVAVGNLNIDQIGRGR